MNPVVFGWITWGEWRSYPLRIASSIIAIAVGVAMGFAVHLVNGAALGEMTAALHTVTGTADLEIAAASSHGFSEDLYPRIARLEGIAVASPVVDSTVAFAGSTTPLDVIGIDVLKAGAVTPALLPAVPRGSDFAQVFDADSLFLSRAARTALGAADGQRIGMLVAGHPVDLIVRGTVPGAAADERIGVMDIGAAQWHLGMLGRLSRIDIKIAPGVAPGVARARIQEVLGDTAHIVTPEERDLRTDSLSRAYRVNLDMLALMALCTGAFLVYSTQSVSVSRRAAQGALLRVLGVGRAQLILQVMCEGTLLGIFGSALGLLAGLGLAALLLRLSGGDLGGGYFAGSHPHLAFAPGAAVTFFALGVGAALLGTFLPARAAARVEPAIALKSPTDPVDPRISPPVTTAVVLLAAGAGCAFLPALDGLSFFGYLAMGLLLFGGILLMPWIAHRTLAPLATSTRLLLPTPLELALKRLWGAPTGAAVALCGIVAATSLMVAMGIMVTSFRQSVDAWVERLIPAALYLHIDGPVESIGMDRVIEDRLAHLDGVSSIDFSRTVSLNLSPSHPPVALIARSLSESGPKDTLFLVSVSPKPLAHVAVWISEAVVDLYGYHAGDSFALPLADPGGVVRPVPVQVAGVWRDYARQSGAIIMRERDYTALTGDALRSDAGFHVRDGVDLKALEDRARAILPVTVRSHAQFARPADIRALSLKIFDRSFAVTYLLEAVAIVIGLVGVAATFSSQTLARAREFGMLRHLGVRSGQIAQMLSWEGALLGAMGVISGLVLGLTMSQILIHVVNPQSFHWTMDTHIPWLMLSSVAALLLVASAGTAVLAGREALTGSVVMAVREEG